MFFFFNIIEVNLCNPVSSRLRYKDTEIERERESLSAYEVF